MKLKGILVASAALGFLAAAPGTATADSHGDGVKCSGTNGCSGKGECAAADGSHDCGGKNSCKGKGWVTAESAKACTDEGGKVVDSD